MKWKDPDEVPDSNDLLPERRGGCGYAFVASCIAGLLIVLAAVHAPYVLVALGFIFFVLWVACWSEAERRRV